MSEEIKIPKIPVEWELKFRTENFDDARVWSVSIHKFLEEIIAHKMYEKAHLVREGTVVGFRLENKGKIADSQVEELMRRYLPLLVSNRAELTDGNTTTTALEKRLDDLEEVTPEGTLNYQKTRREPLLPGQPEAEDIGRKGVIEYFGWRGIVAWPIIVSAILVLYGHYRGYSFDVLTKYLNPPVQKIAPSTESQAPISGNMKPLSQYGAYITQYKDKSVFWGTPLFQVNLKCNEVSHPDIIVDKLQHLPKILDNLPTEKRGNYRLEGTTFLESLGIVKRANGECLGVYDKMRDGIVVIIPMKDKEKNKDLMVGYKINKDGVEDLGTIVQKVLNIQEYSSR